MGSDILWYLDTDLKGFPAKGFLDEVEKRLGGKIKLRGYDESPYGNGSDGKGWSIWCENQDFESIYRNPDDSVLFCYTDDEVDLELQFHENSFCLTPYFKAKNKSNSFIAQGYDAFCSSLDKNRVESIGFLREFFAMIRQIIVPLTHSKNVLLICDSIKIHSQTKHAINAYNFTLEEALFFNKTLKRPGAVYRDKDILNEAKRLRAKGMFYLSLDL